LTGEARYERMRLNLSEALRDEAVLLVLDNFETCLETVRSAEGYRAADAEWDRVLRHLSERLPETPSRLLVTSRYRLAALAPVGRAVILPLGPLPLGEAVHLLQQVPALLQLTTGDEPGRSLALRLLEVSRGHPLILSRLAALAKDRKALAQALDTLTAQGLSALPDVFATAATPEERERERVYLEDVAELSIDLLLARASPSARHLLWLVTHASEPVSEQMIVAVASERSRGDDVPQPDPVPASAGQSMEESRAYQASIPAEGQVLVEPLRQGEEALPVGPLLTELVEAGLLTAEDQHGTQFFGFHELVRERTAHWMTTHPEERMGWTDAALWAVYGERYAAAFQRHRMSGEAGARDQATQVGRRALAYLVRARAYDRLSSFASSLVIGTVDSTHLRNIIGELAGVVDQLPPGEHRWNVQTYLADALHNAARSDEALALYADAAAEAKAARKWRHLGWIYHNWANALVDVGKLDEAKRAYEDSARAEQQGGAPEIDVLGSELEALRIDIYQGHAERVIPEIERRLAKVRGWWRVHQSGQTVPEAPNADELGRLLVAAIDIAQAASRELKRWQACLALLTEVEEVKRGLGEGVLSLASTRFNRSGPLLRLGRLDEAQQLLEGCLDVFRDAANVGLEAQALGGLADLWDERGNVEQAENLERRALAVFNRLSDPAARGRSHENLGIYLERLGKTAPSAAHRIAALVYHIGSGQKRRIEIWKQNLRIFLLNAAAAGGIYELPRLSDLLARPEFEPLRRFLDENSTDLKGLQQTIDDKVAQAQASL